MSTPAARVVSGPLEAARSITGERVRVAHVTTVPLTLHFLRGQVGFMRDAGFAIHAISSPGPELSAFGTEQRVPVHAVAMTRQLTPLRDLRAVLEVWRALRRIRPDVVHAHTPKGGLVGMLAASLGRAPVRVYHLRGLPLVTARGPRRWLLRAAEWTSCRLAHRVLAVSHSVRDLAIAEGLCPPGKITVIAGGSGNGVDAAGRFTPRGAAARLEARASRGIPPDARVIGFVGRLVPDKGVGELASAWSRLRAEDPALHLLLVGLPEAHDPLPAGVLAGLEADPRVHLAGFDTDTPRLYAAMDVVALPTYREGFPNVALEAAAMALPIVATCVSGCVDAVQNEVTGVLVPPRDPAALADALRRYLSDPALRERHGEAARRRALAEFRQDRIWEGIAAEYRNLLVAHR
jgi:glycosyltransferase involved in cell wall biosynthesis